MCRKHEMYLFMYACMPAWLCMSVCVSVCVRLCEWQLRNQRQRKWPKEKRVKWRAEKSVFCAFVHSKFSYTHKTIKQQYLTDSPATAERKFERLLFSTLIHAMCVCVTTATHYSQYPRTTCQIHIGKYCLPLFTSASKLLRWFGRCRSDADRSRPSPSPLPHCPRWLAAVELRLLMLSLQHTKYQLFGRNYEHFYYLCFEYRIPKVLHVVHVNSCRRFG